MKIDTQERALALQSRPAQPNDSRGTARTNAPRENIEALRGADKAARDTNLRRTEVIEPREKVGPQEAPRTAKQKERAEVRVTEKRSLREDRADAQATERQQENTRAERETGRRINVVA